MPQGSWIYEINTPTGGGTPPPYVPPDAPPVTITDKLGQQPPAAEVRETYDGFIEVKVYWKPAATATADNFRGVAVFLEDPDISSKPAANLDGSTTMDASTQVSGKWAPLLKTNNYKSPVVFNIPAMYAKDDDPEGAPQRQIRVYCVAFGKTTNASPVRANDTANTPSPNILINVPPKTPKYVSGMEHAWLITNPKAIPVTSFDDPTGPHYHLNFSYDRPDPSDPLPKGLKAFGGVHIYYDYHDGRGAIDTGLTLVVDKQGDWHSGEYPIATTGGYTVYFASIDVEDNVNEVIVGVTPSVDVLIEYPPPGESRSPYITDLKIDGAAASSGRVDWLFDSSQVNKATLTWTEPDSGRYNRVEFYRAKNGTSWPSKPMSPPSMSRGNRSIELVETDYPSTTQAWTILAISVDNTGARNDDPDSPTAACPRVTWNIGPIGPGGSGQEYAALIDCTNVVIVAEQQMGSDGIAQMRFKISGWRNPTNNNFGGTTIVRVYGDSAATAVSWDVPKSETSFNTDWEPAQAGSDGPNGQRNFKFFFLSRDGSDKRNSLQISASPHPPPGPYYPFPFVPAPGKLLSSRMPTDWFNTSEFDWPPGDTGKFTAKQFVAEKIYVGSILRVGGGVTVPDPANPQGAFQGLQNGQVGVFNNANQLVGWIGQQDGTDPGGSSHRIYGGWFAELYVGGSGPPTAPLYANNTGAVIIGGFQDSAGRVGYLSVHDGTNAEIGRIGSNFATSQNSPSNGVKMSGGWFRDIAIGGLSPTNWKMLVYQDPALGEVLQIRDIYKFTIDFPQKTSQPNPNNAVHLEFGLSAFLADASKPNYFRFPGLSITKTGTTQGSSFVDRGVVIRDIYGYTLGALVLANDDGTGSDDAAATGRPFYGYLGLGNPSAGAGNGYRNVVISSGDWNNPNPYAAYMRLSNGQNPPLENFSVDQNGNVYLFGALGRSRSGANIIDSSGVFVSGGGVNTAGVVKADAGYKQGPNTIIDASGKFWPTNGVDTPGGINANLGYLVKGGLVINASSAFVGAGVNTPGYGIGCSGVNVTMPGPGNVNGVPPGGYTGKTYKIYLGVNVNGTIYPVFVLPYPNSPTGYADGLYVTGGVISGIAGFDS